MNHTDQIRESTECPQKVGTYSSWNSLLDMLRINIVQRDYWSKIKYLDIQLCVDLS